MMLATQTALLSVQGITIADLEALCYNTADSRPNQAGEYHSSANQVFFFALVWAVKESNHNRKEAGLEIVPLQRRSDQLHQLDQETVMEGIRRITENLTNVWDGEQWFGEGAKVTRLKAKENHAWELLRIQLDKALRRAVCSSETKDEALADAVVRIIEMLNRLPSGHDLDAEPDIFAMFVAHQPEFTSIYNFSSPFYAYARQIARFALWNQLQGGQQIRWTDWDVLEQVGTAPHYFQHSGLMLGEIDEKTRIQLQIDLINLLTFVSQNLPLQQRRVSLLTLAARSQFWLVATMAELPLPDEIKPLPGVIDEDLARILEREVNNVRVHRSHVKRRIHDYDAWLGFLWEKLSDPDLSNRLDWWPEI